METLTPHDDDAILLVKRFMSSNQLSQPPLLLFPKAWTDRLDLKTLKVLHKASAVLSLKKCHHRGGID